MNGTITPQACNAPLGASGDPVKATLDETIAAFESLSAASVHELGRIYAPNARFIDPFNDVQGLASVQAIFRHMFETLEQPRFVVTGKVVDGD
ncbi:MAG: nuclear transport factor 2 family protein, partial [Betaproteobacteria bacterium]